MLITGISVHDVDRALGLLPELADAGDVTSVKRSRVSCAGALPSAFMTHTRSMPLRPLMKAIRVPSGEYAGQASRPAVLVSRVV